MFVLIETNLFFTLLEFFSLKNNHAIILLKVSKLNQYTEKYFIISIKMFPV